MRLFSPKIIALDTGTWGYFSYNWRRDTDSRRLLEIFDTGMIVPYLTSLHLQELFQHDSERSRIERRSMIQRLRFVCYPPQEDSSAGCILQVRDLEILSALEGKCKDSAGAIREKATSGFCSGEDFWLRNYHQCWLLSVVGAQSIQKSAATASLTHFELLPRDTILPKQTKKLSVESAETYFKVMAEKLALKIALHGDVRSRPKARSLAHAFMFECFQDVKASIEKHGGIIDDHVASGENKDQPRTLGELQDSVVFSGWLTVHARRLLRNFEELRSKVDPSMIPSWRIYKALDEITKKQITNASGSDLNDKHFAGFLPYIDGVQLDKRLAECYRQAKHRDTLLSEFEDRILPANFRKLIEKLERITS